MAEISQIKLPNNTVLDLKDATAREEIAGMSKVHIIDLEYYDTINNQSIYTSTQTISEVSSMINNNQIVVLRADQEYFYFSRNDSRASYILLLFRSIEYDGNGFMPYKKDNEYANYWTALNQDMWAQPESSDNVNAMLAEMGLSTTAYFNQATVGTARPEHSIVQDIT